MTVTVPRPRLGWRSKDNTVESRAAPVGARAFTGRIDKVTIDLKEMKAAVKGEEDKLRAEAVHKKALSD